ncbi:ribosome biogenesis GTPase Der [Candidatus Poriferisodalis sp.]|uniref:ribosome biogenesis GTPase Der n=1 Tax=Candidatus Poriferisodalis sp. TaxID=3101277 RepID=UPI003C700404
MNAGLPVVGIVGRPNVGKSTLFNRLVGRREAVVAPEPGVTRDRKMAPAAWRGHKFLVVDTGGWSAAGNTLDDKVSAQSERAMADADVLLLLVDVTVGITEPDARIASMLRRSGRPTLVVANKADSGTRDDGRWEFNRLGLGEAWATSALHGRNVGDLLDRLLELLDVDEADASLDHDDGQLLNRSNEASHDEDPSAQDESAQDESAQDESAQDESAQDDQDAQDKVPAVAIVGRPNVGKSTLFNRLIGDERSVVHDRPGTTRDTIDTLVETEAGPVRFVDTAGMRRKARVDADTEYYANLRALRAIDACDVTLLVIDATEGVTAQDQRLAERIDGAGCPIVVLLNKWETLDAEHREGVLGELARRLHFVGEAPVLRISALSGRGVHRLVPAIEAAMEAYESRAPTAKVNEIIQLAQSAQPAPGGARVLYATQVATQPPTFTLFANRELPATYLRYLERRLREALGLAKTPLRLRVRRR